MFQPTSSLVLKEEVDAFRRARAKANHENVSLPHPARCQDATVASLAASRTVSLVAAARARLPRDHRRIGRFFD